MAAIAPPPPGDDSFLANNWWWLTIVGLTLIALIATVAILQPQRQGMSGRVAGAAAGSGRHVRRRTYGPRDSRPATPSMGQRVKRTKVAQNMAVRGAQPKPPKPSFFRRIGNWFRDTEVADTFRARSDARRVQTRSTRGKPPKIKRRR